MRSTKFHSGLTVYDLPRSQKLNNTLREDQPMSEFSVGAIACEKEGHQFEYEREWYEGSPENMTKVTMYKCKRCESEEYVKAEFVKNQ